MKKKLGIILVLVVIISVFMLMVPKLFAASYMRTMENLDRGTVAVKVSNGIFVSWRALGTESTDVGYNLYRGSTKVNSSPITSSTNYVDSSGSTSSTYSVAAVINGSEQSKSQAVSVWGSNYKQIPLSVPSGGTTPDGVSYTYSPNDCSVGDLDNDGEYEIILKWDPSNSKDNSHSGYTGNVYLDAYEMDGTHLWRIDLGRNIRAGAHYTQFMVYDLDSDGSAEIACKTADGTVDGTGNVIGSSSADYRNSYGYILSGPEYLTVFNGRTGAELSTVNYDPPRGTVSSWGDSYGNRVDRFLACIAYLDGKTPSLVMCRGYYTRTVLVAYNWQNDNLNKLWKFDSDDGNSSYAGQGNHNLSVGDVDNDGYDEIIYGSCTIDHNGNGLYNTGLGHGDAMHFGDLDPNRSGLEVWQCHESGAGATFRDAANGSIIYRHDDSGDVGRACSADINSNYPGEESWVSGGSPLYSVTGQNIGSAPSQINFAIWWNGDDSRELLDGYAISSGSGTRLLTATGCSSNNGTKSTPALQADILGDWREEVIYRTDDNSNLRIYTTTDVTSRRIYTLMHDPIYRLGIAWQNVAYNQPPHTGFYLGNGMSEPPVPNITVPGGIVTPVDTEVSTQSPISPTTEAPTTSNGDIDCKVDYIIQNDWGSGGTISVNITNNGSSEIDGWTIEWSFGGNQQIVSLWNAEYTQSGSSVTASNASWNSNVAINRTVGFGFNLTYSGTNTIPATCILNGETIAIE
ncbi:MAG: cellulose binding domain-containing protein [Clostridiales bacterium]